MRKKNLIIIKEQLENFADFFALADEKNFINILTIDYETLFTEKYKSLLKETKLVNVVIVIHEAFYQVKSVEMNEYLKRIYDIPFKNLLLIYTNSDFYNEHNLLSPSRHIYYLSREIDFDLQLNSFILYVIKVFSESIISMRLHDYITDSFRDRVDSEIIKKNSEELKKKNEEIKRLNIQLNRLNEELIEKNRIDSLTRLYNRATIFDFLEQEQTRTNRNLWRMDKILNSSCNTKITQTLTNHECEPISEFLDHYGVLSLMLIDVDRFKLINDTYGHLVGDDVLRYLGQLLMDKEIFRENDVTGRWGGEEFLVVLPDTNVTNATGPAVRFIKKLAEKDFAGAENKKFKVTVSIGISQSSPDDHTKEDIIKRVDEALYWAKENGRNQLIIFEEHVKK